MKSYVAKILNLHKKFLNLHFGMARGCYILAIALLTALIISVSYETA